MSSEPPAEGGNLPCDKLYAALEQLGYRSMLDFARSREAATFPELTEALGTVVAPIQLSKCMLLEAKTDSDRSYFRRTTFVRCLRRFMPKGWLGSSDFEFELAHACGVWASLQDPADYKSALQAIDRIKGASGIPRNWLPDSSDDSHVVRLLQVD